MKKILFLIPMHITFSSFIHPAPNMRTVTKADGHAYGSLPTDFALGALSMSAYLKKHAAVEVRLVDFNVELTHADGFPFEDFFGFCFNHLRGLDFTPDIVGVSSLFSPSFDNFMDCVRASRILFPEALIVGGGSIPTNSYEYIFKDLDCDDFDALCYGEGERPMLDLVRAKDPVALFEESRSWITKEKVIKRDCDFVPKHDFISTLDEIPFYDYDLYNIERSIVNQLSISLRNVEDERQSGFHYMTSRGCPFKCTFCASHQVHGRKMRYHSIERVRADFARLRQEYGAKSIIFIDDHLMGDPNRVKEILAILKDLELDPLFQNGLTLYSLDREMLQAFYDAGTRHLVLPIESGSEKVLKRQMKKPLKMDISRRVAEDCRDLGIYTNANILIGLPGETKEDIREAIETLKDIPVNWYNIACASPLVGSEIHEIAVARGYIEGDTLGADFHDARINTEDFTSEYIQEMRYVMNLELNFVYNNDMRLGDYETALRGFRNVIRLRPDHAFAYFFAAQCCRKQGLVADADEYMKKYRSCAKTSFWEKYVDAYNIVG